MILTFSLGRILLQHWWLISSEFRSFAFYFFLWSLFLWCFEMRVPLILVCWRWGFMHWDFVKHTKTSKLIEMWELWKKISLFPSLPSLLWEEANWTRPIKLVKLRTSHSICLITILVLKQLPITSNLFQILYFLNLDMKKVEYSPKFVI